MNGTGYGATVHWRWPTIVPPARIQFSPESKIQAAQAPTTLPCGRSSLPKFAKVGAPNVKSGAKGDAEDQVSATG